MSGFDQPEPRPRTLGGVTVALTAAAGALDVVTYFAFNQVFASTMTGNLVLLGLGIGHGDAGQVIDNVSAMAGYCLGLILGTVICGLMMRRLPWRNAVGATLTVELAILVGLAAYWYAVDDTTVGSSWKLVVLVVGSGLAMGTQSAATRYIGPTGTPTTFLSGTVTNWVSGLVELHRPRWDGNSAARIGVLVLAAGGNAWIQSSYPEWSFVAPVVLVGVAIVLMALVTRASHGGLVTGAPEIAPDPREEVPEAVESAFPEAFTRHGAGVGHVHGRILGSDGRPRPAVLTLVGPGGEQVDRAHTGDDGSFRVQPPEPGRFVLICSPDRTVRGAARPRAVLVTVDGHPIAHDVVLGATEEQRVHP